MSGSPYNEVAMVQAAAEQVVNETTPRTEPVIQMKERIDALRYTHPLIASKLKSWDDTDDVLARDLKGRCRNMQHNTAVAVPNEKGNDLAVFYKVASDPVYDHLPRGSLEPWTEYATRIGLTPFFPVTPRIVQDRRGAMFASAPIVEVADDIEEALKGIGARGQDFMAILDWLAVRDYTHGLIAVVVDFRSPPADVRERRAKGIEISQQEVEDRKLNRPVLGLYPDRQVLDFQYSRADGKLEWVKLCEVYYDRSGYDGKSGARVELYRVIDRKTITTLEVRKVDGQEKIVNEASINHDAIDENGNPECPVVLVTNSFMAGEIPDAPAAQCVEADLAAARLRSDYLWNLYIHGNEQLTLYTGSDDPLRAEKIAMGASRYHTLRMPNPNNGDPGENLTYLQHDLSAVAALDTALKEMEDKAHELAAHTSPSNSSQPMIQSGVAKAWDYKTGEEKSLREHIGIMEFYAKEILRMITRRVLAIHGKQGEMVAKMEEAHASFNPSFDLADPKENADLNGGISDFAARKGLRAMEKAANIRVSRSLHGLTEEEKTDIEKEIEAAAKAEAKPAAKPGEKPGEEEIEPSEEGESEESAAAEGEGEE